MKYIMLHGLGQSSESWSNTVKVFNDDFEVLCPNLSDRLSGKTPCYDTLYRTLETYCEQFEEPLNICGLSLGGILAMMGHNWSIFLGFKGGRGVATGLGVLIALSPLVALIAFLVWGVIVYFTKLVSLGSIIAAALVPILMYFTGESYWFVGFGALAALFVIVRHWDNIKRLLAGNELKVERIKKD